MKEKKALQYFNEGYNCSQAVLAAYCEDYGLDLVTASKLAVAFGSGLGRQGKVCGCLTGALMVLGLRHGENSTADQNVKSNNYDRTKELCKRFEEVNSAMDCKDIIRNYTNTPAEQKARCSKVLANTVQLLEAALSK